MVSIENRRRQNRRREKYLKNILQFKGDKNNSYNVFVINKQE